MPRHDATTWKLPKGYEGIVGNSNIEIEVRQSRRRVKGTVQKRKQSSDLLGHLLISRGGIEWRPRGGQIRRMNWERFAEEMADLPIRRRSGG